MCCEGEKVVHSYDDLKVVEWRAWLGDGSCLSSLTTTWEQLPDDGLALVALYYRNGTRRIMSGDYVFCAKGVHDDIYGQETTQSFDREELLRRYPMAVIKRLRWTDDATYYFIDQEALS